MAEAEEWSADERRLFDEYRHAGKEHVAHENDRIRVGDRVATPGGAAWAVEERLGGFLIKLEPGPPDDGSTIVGDTLSGREEVFYLPAGLLRRLN
jgi:hypothetical protein